jgi:hypothetical protein
MTQQALCSIAVVSVSEVSNTMAYVDIISSITVKKVECFVSLMLLLIIKTG